MRRIRNTTDESLEIPLIGVTIHSGDVAVVPDEFDDVEFSDVYFEVIEDSRPSADEEQPSNVVAINASDAAASDEGVS